MHKVCLLGALFAVSAHAFTANYGSVSGGQGRIDVGALADQMSLELTSSSGGSRGAFSGDFFGGSSGGLSGGHSGGLSGEHSGGLSGGQSGGYSGELSGGLSGGISGGFDGGLVEDVSGGLAGGAVADDGGYDNTGASVGSDLLDAIGGGSLGSAPVGGSGAVAGSIGADASLGGCVGGNCGSGASGPLAIIRQSKVDFVPVPSDNAPLQPTNLFVDSHMAPVNIVMRQFSHGVNLDVKHIRSKGTYKETQSEDEPSRHVHTVRKPIIQEIREIITPYRYVRQEIQPVKEEIITNVARAVAAGCGPGGCGAGAGAGLGAGLAAGIARVPVALGCSGPGCIQGGFVPIAPSVPVKPRRKCSNRGGCGLARKLAGPVVPTFGAAAVGAAPYRRKK